MSPTFIRTTVLVLFAAVLLLKTFQSLRHRLKERYVLIFFLTSLPFLLLARWPDAIVFLHEHMEMEKPTFMVLGLAAFLILLIFELLSIVSQQDRKIASLAQMVGLLMERERMVERGPGGEKNQLGNAAAGSGVTSQPNKRATDAGA